MVVAAGKAELKLLDKQISLAVYERLKLTFKGRLQIILNTPEVIERLRSRFIDAEVAKQLDYPIFMAVSEHGGKNNSGDYEYLRDADGNYIEDAIGNPEIDQDLVNHAISRDELKKAAADLSVGKQFIPDGNLCSAEAFVKFAVEQGFDFWKEEE